MTNNSRMFVVVTLWLLFGAYFVMASIGGSHISAIATLVCGFMAGKRFSRTDDE